MSRPTPIPSAPEKTRRSLTETLNPTAIFLCIILAACFVKAKSTALSSVGIDFYQFWVGGQIEMPETRATIYTDLGREKVGADFFQKAQSEPHSLRHKMVSENRKTLETYSSPFLYATYHFFSSGNYERDYLTFVLFNLICAIGTIFLLCTLLRLPLETTLAAGILFLGVFEPFQSDIRVANVNQIQLCMLALYLWLQAKSTWPMRGNEFLAGFILSLVVIFKPNLGFIPLLLLTSWIANRNFQRLLRSSLGMALGLLFAFVSANAYFGSATCWASWLDSLRNSIPDSITSLQMGNFSLVRLLQDLTGANMGLVFAIGLGSVAILLILFRRRANAKEAAPNEFLLIGLGCQIYLVAARLVWLHYILLSIPLVLWLLRPANPYKKQHFLAAFAFAIVVMSTLTGAADMQDLIQKTLFTNLGLATLLGAGLWELWTNPRGKVQKT